MHDLGVHNWGFILVLFSGTFVFYLMADKLEDYFLANELTESGKLIYHIFSCLSKVCNIGLGIAVGIEFFMLAHGG